VKELSDSFVIHLNTLKMKKFSLLLLSFAFLTFTSAAEDPPYDCSGGTHYGCTDEILEWVGSLPDTCNCGVTFNFIDYCNDEQIIPVTFPCPE
jgi:hypothetical protein